MPAGKGRFGPRCIMLIRHAEKTGDPGDRGLSDLGRLHAAALADTLPELYGAPDIIIACQSTAKSCRPVQTVEPLASRLGAPVESRWGTYDVGPLVDALRSEPAYAAKAVLICWRHDTIRDIAVALGVEHAPAWPNSLYGCLWLIRADADTVGFTTHRLELDPPERR
jgi:hypothetical protein